jgi:hypothetical protein
MPARPPLTCWEPLALCPHPRPRPQWAATGASTCRRSSGASPAPSSTVRRPPARRTGARPAPPSLPGRRAHAARRRPTRRVGRALPATPGARRPPASLDAPRGSPLPPPHCPPRPAPAGADVVHGHSSHHAKGAELYRGRLIMYGAGDLVSDYEGIRVRVWEGAGRGKGRGGEGKRERTGSGEGKEWRGGRGDEEGPGWAAEESGPVRGGRRDRAPLPLARHPRHARAPRGAAACPGALAPPPPPPRHRPAPHQGPTARTSPPPRPARTTRLRPATRPSRTATTSA